MSVQKNCTNNVTLKYNVKWLNAQNKYQHKLITRKIINAKSSFYVDGQMFD
jgi:hypothetical protein